MKEFAGSAFNVMFAEDGEALCPVGEVILITSEPEYVPDGMGAISRRRTVSSFRFAAGETSLRLLARYLVEYADYLIEAEKRHAKKPRKPPAEGNPHE